MTQAIDPAIKALFDKLPEPGTKWTAAKRAHFLRCLESLFLIVYETEDGSVHIAHPAAERLRSVA